MKRILFVLACIFFCYGCTHIVTYEAIDQGLFSKAARDAVGGLNIPDNLMHGQAIYLRVVGFSGTQRLPGGFRENYPASAWDGRREGLSDRGILLEEKVLEAMRKKDLDIVPQDKAELEYVVQAEVNGQQEQDTDVSFPLILPKMHTSPMRAFRVKLHAYLFNVKTKKILHTADSAGSAVFGESSSQSHKSESAENK